jgi:endonuclease/exonuclease/phosphatase (EEP) superfamily protein YafD
MKHISKTSGIFITAMIASCGSQQARVSSQRSETPNLSFCIQSFNAYGPAYSTDIKGRSQDVAEELSSDPCDIISMQEVWKEWHHDFLAAALTSSLPQMSAIRFENVDQQHQGNSGLSIFTSNFPEKLAFEKFKLNKSGFFDRIRGMLKVIKGMGMSEISLRSEPTQKINLIDLHTHQDRIPVRIAQMTQLILRYETMLPLKNPIIIAGDFNATPDSIEYQLIESVAGFTDSYKSVHSSYEPGICTYCANNPHHWGEKIDRVIDYIWMRSSPTASLFAATAVINLKGQDGIIPSDHFGRRSEFEIKNQAPALLSNEAFSTRCHHAVESLNKAIEFLEQNDSTTDDYAETYNTLINVRNRFQNPMIADVLVQQLRIP